MYRTDRGTPVARCRTGSQAVARAAAAVSASPRVRQRRRPRGARTRRAEEAPRGAGGPRECRLDCRRPRRSGGTRGRSSMVEPQSSKLATRVRFPSPAPPLTSGFCHSGDRSGQARDTKRDTSWRYTAPWRRLGYGAKTAWRGSIDLLPSGALRVRVYAGERPGDQEAARPRRDHPARSAAERQAEAARDRLRQPRSTRAATRGRRDRRPAAGALPRPVRRRGDHARRSTARTSASTSRRYLGRLKVGALDADVLDSFYAELRRCRDHCSGRRDDRPPHDGRARVRRRCGPHGAARSSHDGPAHALHPVRRLQAGRPVALGGGQPDAQAEPPPAPTPNPHRRRRRRPRGSSTRRGGIRTGACSSGSR